MFGGEGVLHFAEEGSVSRQGDGHRAQLSEHLVPFSDNRIAP